MEHYLPIDCNGDDSITRYLRTRVGDDATLLSLADSALRRGLLTETRLWSPVFGLMQQAMGDRALDAALSDLNCFTPEKSRDIDALVGHVVDWLRGTLVTHAERSDPAATAWLDNTDAMGCPKKLAKLHTLERVTAEADKAMRRAAMKQRQAMSGTAPPVTADPHVAVVKTFADNGLYIVRILTTKGLDIESANMDHCVGHGAYDKTLKQGKRHFYSLRDAANMSHATLEIDMSNGIVSQYKGRRNRAIKDPYREFVDAFIRENNFIVSHSWSDLIAEDPVEWTELLGDANHPTGYVATGPLPDITPRAATCHTDQPVQDQGPVSWDDLIA